MRSTAPKDHQLSLLGTANAAATGTVDPGRDMQEETTQKPARQAKQRRPRGTGAVVRKGDRWYGQWYLRGRLVKRSLGPMRQPGTRDGLTKSQAEVRLRELMTETNSAPPPVAERLTVGQVGSRLIKQLALKGRKSSTTENYKSYLRVHIEPHFADKPIAQITAADVEDFVEACLDRRLSTKSTLNYLGFLHSIFDFAVRKRWAHVNPCDEVEKPGRATEDEEIRFLDQAELEALLRAMEAERSPHNPATIERAATVRRLRDVDGLPWKQVAAEVGCAESTAIYLYRCDPELRLEDDLARVERVLYLTAAMSGLRQGELLALRWMDVDWLAQRIRVRRNFVRGQVRVAQVEAVEPLGPARRCRRRRARRAVQDLGVHSGRGPRLRSPAHGEADGSLAAAQALQAGAEAGRGARGSVPRPETYVRNPDGGGRACRCGRSRSGWATATTRPR